jgi:hypothetical protein
VTYLENQAYSSKTGTWYTPEKYIEAARRVFGGSIWLDPASDEAANSYIKAVQYFDVRQDGLRQDWLALSLWLNPPFDASKEFAVKLLKEWKEKNFNEGIALFKFVPSYKWFKPLADFPMVITDHRVSFWAAPGVEGSSRFDNAICFVYFGDHPVNFYREFGQFGYRCELRGTND